MTGALLRNPRILACVLLAAAAVGGVIWYSFIPDDVPSPLPPVSSANQSPSIEPASNPVAAQTSSRDENEAKAAKLFAIADTAGMKRAFEQLEAEFDAGKLSRARVWFALKSILRAPKCLPDVVAELKQPNERAEVLFAGVARLVREHKLKPEAVDALKLSERERSGVQGSMVSVLAEDGRISEALNVLRSMTKSDQRAGALLTMVENYARVDAANAVNVVKTLGDEDQREARSVLISVYREKGYADGLRQMLQDSQEEGEKARLVSAVVKAYGSYRDNVSASQFVDSLDGSLREVGRKALGETFR